MNNNHAWCRSPSRDEAVRAAEDNRQCPLPTLEEAIAALSPSEEGLRTERVTLEIVRGDGLHVRHWPWHDILKAWGLGEEDEAESVRVVEEVHFDDLANMSLERNAAIRERDEARQHHARECEKCAALADKVISLKARVSELESAPAASGVSNSQPISGAGKSAETGTQEPDAWGVRRNGLVDAVSHRSQRSSAERSAEQWGGTVVPLYAAPQPASGWLTAEEREAVSGIALVVGRLKIYPLQPCRTKQDDIDLLWRIAEGKARSASAASGAAGTEPVAWEYSIVTDHGMGRGVTLVPPSTIAWVEIHEADPASCVPLYTAPQPAKGWLTVEEREAVTLAAQEAPDSDFVTVVEGKWINKTLTDLLARSTPPEVVRPGKPLTFRYGDDAMANRDGQWLAALAAAGVTVKEVG